MKQFFEIVIFFLALMGGSSALFQIPTDWKKKKWGWVVGNLFIVVMASKFLEKILSQYGL